MTSQDGNSVEKISLSPWNGIAAHPFEDAQNGFANQAAGSVATEAYDFESVTRRHASENAVADRFQHHRPALCLNARPLSGVGSVMTP